jgi:hypothetical protein
VKYWPSSHDFNKLVIKAKNTCLKHIFDFFFVFFEWKYDMIFFFFIFERLGRMHENKIYFCFIIFCNVLTKKEIKCVFWKKNLIELQHAKLRLVNPKKLNVFWLQKWLDAWKWDEVTKKIYSSHMNWTTPCS